MGRTKRLKLIDESEISKMEYVILQFIYTIIWCYAVYELLPVMVPIAYYHSSISRAVVCMSITSVFGMLCIYWNQRYYKEVVIDAICGMGVYTTLTLGQFLPVFVWILVSLTIVLTVIGVMMIVQKKKKNRRMRKRIVMLRLLRCFQLIRRNVSIAAGILLFVVPISLHFFKNDRLNQAYYEIANHESGTESEYVTTGADLLHEHYDDKIEVEQYYGDEYRLSQNIDTIKWIRDNDTFQTLDYEQKCDVIEAIIYCEARYLGLCKINIKFQEINDDVLGYYLHSTRTITINSKPVMDGTLTGGTSEEILKTCLHEARHCYQHLIAEMYLSITPEQRNLFVFRKYGVLDWISDFLNYVDGSEDLEAYFEYYRQSVEDDARAYADEESGSYYRSIDKLLNTGGNDN